MKICWGFCGSFCTAARAISALETLKNTGHDLLPVFSFSFQNIDTRFGKASDICAKIEEICGKPAVRTLAGAEPVGPVEKPDLMIVAPLTGNSLSKLSHGVSDTPVTLAAKAHLRNGRPLLLALASNDALGGNFENLARLYARKNIYFVPLLQDDPARKPNPLVAQFERIPAAAKAAVEGRQLLPLFVAANSGNE